MGPAMGEHSKAGQRLGLVAMTLASLAAPVLIQDNAAAAASGNNMNALSRPQTGSRNTIILGTDGKLHNQTIILGNDGKPQNNRFVLGRDGNYHDTANKNAILVLGGQPSVSPNAGAHNP